MAEQPPRVLHDLKGGSQKRSWPTYAASLVFMGDAAYDPEIYSLAAGLFVPTGAFSGLGELAGAVGIVELTLWATKPSVDLGGHSPREHSSRRGSLGHTGCPSPHDAGC